MQKQHFTFPRIRNYNDSMEQWKVCFKIIMNVEVFSMSNEVKKEYSTWSRIILTFINTVIL